jgi:hypothetical protein
VIADLASMPPPATMLDGIPLAIATWLTLRRRARK